MTLKSASDYSFLHELLGQTMAECGTLPEEPIDWEDNFRAVQSSSWPALTKDKREMRGLAMDTGVFVFALTAQDSSGQQAVHSFSVEVIPPQHQYSHRFDMTLDSAPVALHSKLPLFVEKLAKAMGDADTSHIHVRSARGDTIGWTNVSLPTNRCGQSQLERLRTRMVGRQNHSVTPTASFERKLAPEFKLVRIQLVKEGVCAQSPLPTSTVVSTHQTDPPPTPPAAPSPILLTTLVPVVLLLMLLIIATIVVCVLYKRNKNNKLIAKEAKSQYVSKGNPHI